MLVHQVFLSYIQLTLGYRNQSWIPGKNARAADVISSGIRVPMKFW